MARAAALRDVPEELPVIAGLAESGLRNLHRRGNPYAGFFSMHRSLDRGPTAASARKPRLQLDWFLDSAVLARQREIAEGDADYASDPAGYGPWVADVERPARANRSGYQRYLEEADGLLSESVPPRGSRGRRPAAGAARARRKAPARRDRARGELSLRALHGGRLGDARAGARGGVRGSRGRHPRHAYASRRARRSARLTVTVTAVDEAGNATRIDRSVLLLR